MKKTHLLKKTRFLFALFFSCVALSYASAAEAMVAQNVSVRITKGTLEDAFKQMMKDKHIQIVYEPSEAARVQVENVNYVQADAKKVLDALLAKSNLTYEQINGVYTIKRKAPSKTPTVGAQQEATDMNITGVIKDDTNQPLPGASIRLKTEGQVVGTATDLSGKFVFPRPVKEGDVLIVSFIGMDPKEVTVEKGKLFYEITLGSSTAEIEEVVISTGIIQRNKMGFTGSYNTVSQAELKAVGNTNVLQSLKSLDPSFVIADDVQFGSNPNEMPDIQVRGKSTLDIQATRDQSRSNANSPLFILDGFESTLQEVNDIDINRIESMTILKDAGSTAIYGAKGANGVIIVETIKPKPGEIMIDYTGDFKVSFADLSQYNLMNAAEKLEYERKAGYWGDLSAQDGKTKGYYARLKEIGRGVDTYWLKEPIRTALMHSHSVTASGGGENGLLFYVNANYKNSEGVMKDSYRETYGMNVKISYRGINNLSIVNSSSIYGVTANDGAWTTGNSFSEFAKANPYFRKRFEDGTLPMRYYSYSESIYEPKGSESDKVPAGQMTVYNPLYNASLSSYQKDRTFSFTNNTQIDWYAHQDIRLTGTLSLRRWLSDYDSFTDPMHTQYIATAYDKKGQRKSTNENEWSVSARLNAVYTKSIQKNNFTVNLMGQMEEINFRSKGYVLEGFHEGSEGLPTSGRYVENGTPPYTETKQRNVTAMLAFNYNYDFRYLFDFSFNEEGSTAFGRNKKFQEFWSVGLGWNIDREKFAQEWSWLSHLKLSGSVGINSNTAGGATTSSIFKYYTGNNVFGQGAYLNDFGNPNLAWTEVKKTSFTLDGGFLDRRLTAELSYFINNSDPMIIPIEQKPSSGIGLYYTNMGVLKTKGIEFITMFYPIFNRKENIMLGVRIMGAHKTDKYDKISDEINSDNDDLGKDATSLNSLIKYQNGSSSTAIWAVRSAGIDPATGKEIFINRDGTQTFDYDIKERVKVGDTEPTLYGTLNLNFIYKKLEANFILRYSFGGDKLNTDLYNKVENIHRNNMIYNQDKRALYDRWQKPGDVTEFTSIKQKSVTGQPLSSRFVQRNNYIRGESVKISWDFSKDEWVQKIGLRNLKLALSMNDIFNVYNIKVERGTAYPYERSVSLNLSARF